MEGNFWSYAQAHGSWLDVTPDEIKSVECHVDLFWSCQNWKCRQVLECKDPVPWSLGTSNHV